MSKLDSDDGSNSSHLPSWVIRMREKIESSRVNLASTQNQINNLVMNTLTLHTEIQKSQHASKASSECERNDEEQSAEIRSKRCFLLNLHPDAACYLSSFLKLSDVIAMDASSKNIQLLMLSTAIWPSFFKDLPHLHARYSGRDISRIEAQQLREEVRRHYFDSKECIQFLRTMKEQRCVPRHRTIAPRMYTTQDNGISHPLPIFEPETVAAVGRIMSRTETLDRDFRSVALSAMETIARITSMPSDLQHDLARESAATIFISLLSNEAQQLKYLACSCLANILCWEAQRTGSVNSIKLQVELCDGAKVLLSLLTSPSASINLAGNLRNGASTAPIQGMCNREGARALVNLFSVGDAWKVPPPSLGTTIECGGIENCGSCDSAKMNEFIVSEFPKLRAWRFTYYTRSGAVKDEFTCYCAFSVDGFCRGRGCDSIGFFILEGVAEVDIQGMSWKISKQYLSQSALEELTSVLQPQDEEGHHSSRSIQRGGAHVIHTCYYTPGLTSQCELLDGLYPRFGLFGVWEGASTGSHFELQKGGVLRAIPVMC